MITLLSALPLTTRDPSFEMATEVIRFVCPVNVCKMLPVAMSQTIILLSALPLTIFVPSLDIATDNTPDVWPLSLANRFRCDNGNGLPPFEKQA